MNQYTDSLDSVYTAFPIHERREMIKIILIPCMNILKFFFRFFVQSPSEKKFLKISKQPQVRQMTSRVSEIVATKVTAIDEHLEDRVSVAIQDAKRQEPLHADIYYHQRKALQCMLYCEG